MPGAPAPTAAAAPATISVTGGGGASLDAGLARRLLRAGARRARRAWTASPYRGSLRVLVNPRGTLNVVNRVDLEEYLYGVVPAEMGPKRFDAIEALKAQAVAARTYALAHRGQFEAEGYDICATPKCQVYGGASPSRTRSRPPRSTATRGLVLAYQGQFADALFVSTCGGRHRERRERLLAAARCRTSSRSSAASWPPRSVAGASLPRDGARPADRRSQWRGYVLRRHAPRKAARARGEPRDAPRSWAGVPRHGLAARRG